MGKLREAFLKLLGRGQERKSTEIPAPVEVKSASAPKDEPLVGVDTLFGRQGGNTEH